jgi:hypothetical protein
MPIPTQLTLTQEIEPQDEIDKFLLEELLLIVQNNQTMELVNFWGHSNLNLDKSGEKYLKKILRSINALIKVNALRRNYILVMDKVIEDIGKDKTLSGTNIDILFNKVDAFILIEAFFTQIKTSLDLLAQSFKPLYGINFTTWERKDNRSISDIRKKTLANFI